MDFFRNVYISMVSRQVAFLLDRGQTFPAAILQTSFVIGAAMGMNMATVAVFLGWRPRSRFELAPIVIGLVVFGVFERMNAGLIRRWVGSECERKPARWPSLVLFAYLLGSFALMVVVIYLMVSPR
jgi:hypothetical protein